MDEDDAYDARARALKPWHCAFLLLSLDCWLPFWRDMGLSFDDEQQIPVRDAARSAYHALHGNDRNCYDGDYRPEIGEPVRAAFLETVGNELGKSVADGLPAWVGRNCGYMGLGGMLDAQWWAALADLSHAKQYGESAISLTPDRLAMLVSLIHTELMKPPISISGATKQVQTVTAWDRKVRKAHFDPYRPGHDEVPCRAKVSLFASRLRFRRLWSRLTEICTKDEIAALRVWYRVSAGRAVKQRPELDRLPLPDWRRQ